MKKIKLLSKPIRWLVVIAIIATMFPGLQTSAESGVDVTQIQNPSAKAIIENYEDWLNYNLTKPYNTSDPGYTDPYDNLRLPETVKVTAGGGTYDIAVDWGEKENVLATLRSFAEEGVYYLTGTLDADSLASFGLTNTKNMTATQTIWVRPYLNILTNGDFENADLTAWENRLTTGCTQESVPGAGAEDSTALRVNSLDFDNDTYIFAGQNASAALKANGPGEYYMGALIKLEAENLTKGIFFASMQYYENGVRDSYMGTYSGSWTEGMNPDATADSNPPTTPAATTPEDGYKQLGRRFLFNYTAANPKLNFLIAGNNITRTGDFSILIDNCELVPLNVTLPPDIVLPKPPGAEPGSPIEQILKPNTKAIVQNYDTILGEAYTTASLRLPEKIVVKANGGMSYEVGVNWDTSNLNLAETGTYELDGTLDEQDLLRYDIENINNLPVTQAVEVREWANLLPNPGFETDDVSKWSYMMYSGTRSWVNAPTRDNSAGALKSTGIDQRYHIAGTDIKNILEANGPGEYYFGVWARLESGLGSLAADERFRVSLEIKAAETPNANNAAIYTYTDYMQSWARPDQEATDKCTVNLNNKLSDSEYSQVANRTLIQWGGPIDYAVFSFGTYRETSGAIPQPIYLDDAEFVALNVTLPSNNISSYTSPKTVIVDEGTAFEALELPETLTVFLENGQTKSVGVTWLEDGYSADTPGTYIIYGIFTETSEISNNNSIIPQICVEVVAEGSSPGTIYYFSTSGSNSNDGTSYSTPKKTLTQEIINTLGPGDTILFKRGDEWYDPNISWDFTGIKGTEEFPITIGAYGEGSPPVIAALKKIETAWTDEGSGIYSTEYATNDLLRVYVDEALWAPAMSLDTIKEGEYMLKEGKLYLKSSASPNKVEILATSDPGNMINFFKSEYITIKDLIIKGTKGGSNPWLAISAKAPTEGIKLSGLKVKQIAKYAVQFTDSGEPNATNKNIVIENCLFDRVWSEAYYRNMLALGYSSSSFLTCDGLDFRNAVNGAIVRGNTITNFGHTAINCEIYQPTTQNPLVTNCIIEDNIISKGNSQYLRAFEFSGTSNTNMNNIFRRNYCYDLTGSSHFLGQNNLCYSNIFTFITPTTAQTTTVQPYAIDMMPWVSGSSVWVAEGNVLINNTIYNTVHSVRISGAVYNGVNNVGKNLIANNIMSSWSGSAALTIESYREPQVVRNNVFWNGDGTYNSIRQLNSYYTVEDANKLSNMDGNMQGDPMFKNPDGDFMSRDFTLSDNSPYLHAGLPLDSISSEEFPAIAHLKEPGAYTDFYGNPFLAYAPTVGAVSYQQTIDPERNFLENPGYETGYTSPWSTDGKGSVISDPENVFNGNYSLFVSKRSNSLQGAKYYQGTKFYDILSENGVGDYYIEVWAKLGENAYNNQGTKFNISDSDSFIGSARIQMWLPADADGKETNVTVNSAGNLPSQPVNLAQYAPDWVPAQIQLSKDEYRKISFVAPLWIAPVTTEGKRGDMMLYFATDSQSLFPDLYLDNWAMIKCFQITSVKSVNNITVKTGTPLTEIDLPKSIEVTLDNGDTMILPVSWGGSYDENTEGSYSLVGEIIWRDTPGISNRKNKIEASCTVTVKSELDIIHVENLPGIKVLYGTDPATAISKLPSSVDVKLEDGNYARLDITWDAGSYDPETPGDYIITGTFETADGVNTTSANITAVITVKPEIGIGDEILENGDFSEDPKKDWNNWGGTISYTMDPGNVRSEGGAMIFTLGSNQWYQSPVQTITDQVRRLGQGTYYLEVWVKLLSGPEQTVRARLCINDARVSDNSRCLYTDPVTLEPGGDYVKVSGYFNVTWQEPLGSVLFVGLARDGYQEPAVIVFDDASLRKVDLLENHGFEDDSLSPWYEGADNTSASLASDSDNHFVAQTAVGPNNLGAPHSYHGQKAVKSSNRDSVYKGPAQDVTTMVKKFGPGVYMLSAYAKTGSGTDTLQLGLRVTPNGGEEPVECMTDPSEISNSFSLCKGMVTIPRWNSDAPEKVEFFVKTGTTIDTVFFDDCSLYYMDSLPPVNLPPVFEAMEDISANVGSKLEFTVSATDPDGDQLTYSAENLPEGATFDAQTRTFSWTPQAGQEETYTVTFTVTDGVNQVEIAVNITVKSSEEGYAFAIEDVSIDKQAGIAVEATVTSNTTEGGNAVVIFKLMKNDGTVIGLYSCDQYIENSATFRVKFHGYSGVEYKVKIYVWDELDSSVERIGTDLAEPVEIQ